MNKGYLTLIAAIFTSLMLGGALIFTDYVFNIRKPAIMITYDLDARLIAEAGLEKAIWKLNDDTSYIGETATTFGDGQFTITIANIDSSTKRITSTGYYPNAASYKARRKAVATVKVNGNIVAFNYGVQVGNGGFEVGNNSQITGNIYSNGTIKGASGAQITGDAISAGPSGKIEDIVITGTARAHTLEDCTVNGDGYYVVKTRCTVNGTSNEGSTDPETTNFPIGDSEIDVWKNQAIAGGTVVGNVTINSSQSYGPKKIEGNLVLGNNVTLTMTGTIWVTGSITLGNSDTIQLDPGYNGNSGVLVADGTITLGNSATFTPAGEDSYILLLSESSSGSAITIGNSSNSVILYARYGTISVGNNISLKELTANKIILGNGSSLVYDSGLADETFTGGPGGSWGYNAGTYFSE